MFTKRELLDAISECEKNPHNYNDCAKLATFYTLYDHLFPGKAIEQVDEKLIGCYGETDFLAEICGMDAETVWPIIDELMSTLRAMEPRLYQGVMTKLAQSK